MSATSEAADPPVDQAVKKVGKSTEDTATTVHIKIFSPHKIYFDDDAKSISAENDTGPFDVLPRHHNFITLVKACELLIKTLDDQEKRIRISKAVMHVRRNIITIFLDV